MSKTVQVVKKKTRGKPKHPTYNLIGDDPVISRKAEIEILSAKENLGIGPRADLKADKNQHKIKVYCANNFKLGSPECVDILSLKRAKGTDNIIAKIVYSSDDTIANRKKSKSKKENCWLINNLPNPVIITRAAATVFSESTMEPYVILNRCLPKSVFTKEDMETPEFKSLLDKGILRFACEDEAKEEIELYERAVKSERDRILKLREAYGKEWKKRISVAENNPIWRKTEPDDIKSVINLSKNRDDSDPNDLTGMGYEGGISFNTSDAGLRSILNGKFKPNPTKTLRSRISEAEEEAKFLREADALREECEIQRREHEKLNAKKSSLQNPSIDEIADKVVEKLVEKFTSSAISVVKTGMTSMIKSGVKSIIKEEMKG